MSDATVMPEATTMEKPKSGGMLNNSMYAIIGGIVVLCLCVLCCCSAFAWMTSTEDFRDGYCEGWLEENVDFDDEPFGWCEDYRG